jgi:ABC-type transport system involved in multi-copper enzyme maturation permease subunit
MRARIFLTLKQQRFETIAVTVVCLALAAGAGYEAWRLFSLHTPLNCLGQSGFYVGPMMPGQGAAGTDPCLLAQQQRYGVLNSLDMNLIRTLLVFAPFVSGIAIGVPLVAREVEQGTAPLSWALAGSRWHWLVSKLVAVTLLFLPLLIALAVATDFLESALVPNVDPHATLDSYGLRGVVLVFWGLAAFSGTVALGTLLGRTLPAVFLALVICGFVRVAWEPLMNREVLAPSAQVLVDPTKVSDQNGTMWNDLQNDLVFRWASYLDGKPISDQEAQDWWNTHMQTKVDAQGNVYQEGPSQPGQGPQSVPMGLPGSMYWPVVVFESGFLFAGALFCGAVALLWVERRRPY